MKEIKKIIKGVENGEIELVNDYDFYESIHDENYIIHYIKNSNIKLLFKETPERKKWRKDYDNASDDMREYMLIDYPFNDLADEFNYDTVAGYDNGTDFVLF